MNSERPYLIRSHTTLFLSFAPRALENTIATMKPRPAVKVPYVHKTWVFLISPGFWSPQLEMSETPIIPVYPRWRGFIFFRVYSYHIVSFRISRCFSGYRAHHLRFWEFRGRIYPWKPMWYPDDSGSPMLTLFNSHDVWRILHSGPLRSCTLAFFVIRTDETDIGTRPHPPKKLT